MILEEEFEYLPVPLKVAFTVKVRYIYKGKLKPLPFDFDDYDDYDDSEME